MSSGPLNTPNKPDALNPADFKAPIVFFPPFQSQAPLIWVQAVPSRAFAAAAAV